MILLEQIGVNLPIDLNAISGTVLSMAVLLGIVVDTSTDGLNDATKEANNGDGNKQD